MKRALRAVFVGAMIFFSGGCVTGHLIKEADRSLPEIKNAIYATMGQPREVATNEREFESVYFSKKKIQNFDPEKSKERNYAKVTVLGDRRPYDIQVQVFLEERVNGNYEDAGLDEELSDQIAEEIKKALRKSRDQRNVIDDFRAF
ncbi:MAG: hypothetical protein ACK5P7_12170 [Bdellovibrio sp.]|jgi:hypothetical protein